MEFKNTLYFRVGFSTNNGTSAPQELWKVSGEAAEFVHDLPSGTINNSNNTGSSRNILNSVATTDNRIYLRNTVRNLISTDGTLNGLIDYREQVPFFRTIYETIVVGNDVYVFSGIKGVAGWGPMTIYRVTDNGDSVELIFDYPNEIWSPRVFRGELYFAIAEGIRKVDSSGAISEVQVPDVRFGRLGHFLFQGDDTSLLFRSTDNLNGMGLWQIR